MKIIIQVKQHLKSLFLYSVILIKIGYDSIISLQSSDNWIFRRISIKKCVDAIDISHGSWNTFENIEIEDCSRSGISFYDPGLSNQVINCNFINIKNAILLSFGENNYIYGNYIKYPMPPLESPQIPGVGIEIRGGKYNWIENNTFIGGIPGHFAPPLFISTNRAMNIIKNNTANTQEGGAYMFIRGTQVLIEENDLFIGDYPNDNLKYCIEIYEYHLDSNFIRSNNKCRNGNFKQLTNGGVDKCGFPLPDNSTTTTTTEATTKDSNNSIRIYAIIYKYFAYFWLISVIFFNY